MNVLDENILKDQRDLLLQLGVPIRQIGYEVGRKGMKDDEIIPFLLKFRRPTFFTLDFGFYKRQLCHGRYCLVYLDVGQQEAAKFIRRLLRYKAFNTQAKRMGTVIRVSPAGLSAWHQGGEKEATFEWA